jgi:hypothetical protein
VDLVASVRRRLQVLAPVLDPFHRTPDVHRGPRHQQLFGINGKLGAESAAYLRGDDPHRGLRKAQAPRDFVAHAVRDLGGRPDGQRRLPAIARGHDPAWLDRNAGQPLIADSGTDDLGGAGERRLDVAPHPRRLVGNVRLQRLVDGGSLGSGVDVDHDGPAIQLNPDQIGGITSLLARLGHHEGDQITGEGDLAIVEQGPGRKPAAPRTADREAGNPLEVGGGDDRDDPGRLARFRQIESDDGGVRKVAADKDQVGQARRSEVIEIGAGAGDQPGILTTAYPGAETLRQCHGAQLTGACCG